MLLFRFDRGLPCDQQHFPGHTGLGYVPHDLTQPLYGRLQRGAARGKQFPSIARRLLISYLPQNVAVQDGPHVVEVSR